MLTDRIEEPRSVAARIAAGAAGPTARQWEAPDWLLPHQVDAARGVVGRLTAFGAAVLADAVGLGKTYVAVAVARGYASATAVVPASLADQWRRVSGALVTPLRLVSHESLSRGGSLDPTDIVIVDEAHRFRNAATKRYRALAAGVRDADVLFLTATPVVNRASDLTTIIQVALADHALAAFGVRSLAEASRARRTADLMRALAPLIVARSHHDIPAVLAAMPRCKDHPVSTEPPVHPDTLTLLLEGIGRLEFPNVHDRTARELLRLHLLHRLSSSAAALRGTLRRHWGYLERAIAALHRGQALSRGAAARFYRDLADLQLELPWRGAAGTPAVDPALLETERERIAWLLARLPPESQRSPKAEVLLDVLRARHGERTIVFTASRSTALDLAARLGWRRVAVVAGGKGHIATGPIAAAHALDLFAPVARHAREPARHETVTTLIATDLVSEGLDLQDADAVVHYDLPWTPVRLIQRWGRVARLGSRHPTALVWWFAPPGPLERRMALATRLAIKAGEQAALGAAATSTVGQAQRFGGEARARQALTRFAEHHLTGTRHHQAFAVVQGPAVGVALLEWTIRGVPVPEIVLIGEPCAPYQPHFPRVWERLTELARRSLSTRSAPPDLWSELETRIAARVRASDDGPCDAAVHRLARLLILRARATARRRAHRELELLDTILARLHAGLRRGALDHLAHLLERGAALPDLERWIRDRREPAPSGVPAVRLVAALVGDGSDAG